MSDSLSRVSAQSPLVIPADAYNLFVDVARQFRERRGGQEGEPGRPQKPTPALHCWLKNTEPEGGTTIPAFSVSRYGAAIVVPAADDATSRHEASRTPAFDAETPSSAADQIAITIEPIPGQELGRAVCAGLVAALIAVSDESHERAVPVAGNSTNLASARSGGFPIVWKPAGTGQLWGLVLLGASDGGGPDCRATLASLLPTDRVTFQVQPGNLAGWCAEIEPATLVGYRPDADVERWVSIGTFPTALGDTSLTLTFDADTGEPVVSLSGTQDAGSAGTVTVTKKLVLVGCVGGCLEFAARPDPWCDSSPVTDADQCPDGAPRRYRWTLAGGTGGYAVLNGTHTFLHDSANTWTVTTPGFIGSMVWVDMGGGDRQLQTQFIHVATSAFASWAGPTVPAVGMCCASVTMDFLADFDPGTGGAGDVPELPTVTAVGPCFRQRCADNTFRVRVCCKGHTKYGSGCDAVPYPLGTMCLWVKNGVTGEWRTDVIDSYGPYVWGAGPSSPDPHGGQSQKLFRCDAGDSTAADPTRILCGWDILPAGGSSDPLAGYPLDPIGLLIRLIVYYDPDANDGDGAWVMTPVTLCGLDDCCFGFSVVAANDPDPTDDPFEIVFRWETSPGSGNWNEVWLTPGPCDTSPTSPPPPPSPPSPPGPPPPPVPTGCCTGGGEDLAAGPAVKVTVPDGAYAGVYTLTATGSPSPWTYTGAPFSVETPLVLNCSGSYLLLGKGSVFALPLTLSCTPFGATYDMAGILGSTTDVIVELA